MSKGMKIIDTLNSIDRSEVQAISFGINDAFLRANGHAEEAIKAYIEAGQLLMDARKFFPGDLEFGQWRKENTTVSKSWANKLMKVYETYGQDIPKGLPVSALAELAGASEDLQQEVIEKAADPEQKTPSVRDIKAEVKAENEGNMTGAELDAQVAANREKMAEEAAEKRREQNEKVTGNTGPSFPYQTAIDASIPARITGWDESDQAIEDAYVLLGLSPYFDGEPNYVSVEMLAEALNEHTPDDCWMGANDVIIGA